MIELPTAPDECKIAKLKPLYKKGFPESLKKSSTVKLWTS